MNALLDTTPFWSESARLPHFPPLSADDRVDVVVVGGGITGLTAAYLLLCAGRTVAVLERERAAESETGHTSAHLTMVTDLPMTDLIKQYGRDHAQAVWDAGLAAIDQIDTIVRDERIVCDFEWVPGYLHSYPDRADRDAAWLRDEATLAAELGFDATFVENVPFVHACGVQFDNQARIHPRKYLNGLAWAIMKKGGRIYENSAVTEFSENPRWVCANRSRVFCDDVVVATHNPLIGSQSLLGATLFQTKLSLYSTYVVTARVKSGTLPDALLWDTADPYHYYRLSPEGDFDLVVYGGEDHKTGQDDDTRTRYKRVERQLASLVPNPDIVHHWSGQVIETHDGLPYIGTVADHQFAGTGYSGNGLTFGTLAAIMACDGILGRTNPWADLFSPDRKKIGSAWDYIKENLDYPYYMIRDRFAGTEGRSARAVKRGHGNVIDHEGRRVAAFRDESGVVTLRSATCTHMGCLVAWNVAEKTWDCPCHGSRFTPEGNVFAGPAESPLPEIKSS